MIDGRQSNGRFAPGNAGGPGRPRRTVEADYLRALADAVPVDAWRAIVSRAVEDALNGDPKAREWLGRYLLGAMPATLQDLAVEEAAEADDFDLAVMRRRAQRIHEEASARYGL